MVTQENDSRDSVDYSLCPIPKTHRRLVEVHVLWHQALAQYQQPEVFRANLNALIQALRNVTFILQSEKYSFSDFDDWYKPWQERLKGDAVCKWVVDARNKIVKQGELDTNSTAVVKLVTWRDDLLLESQVPPGAPSSLIMRNVPLMEHINNVHVPQGDLKSAAISIERRWVVDNLEDWEIQGALAHAYAVLAELVLDAHIHLQDSSCISIDQEHSHFPSVHDRTGVLRCMSMGVEARTQRFDLATGQEFESFKGPEAVADATAVTERYGLEEDDRFRRWQGMDPIVLAKKISYIAKRILSRDKSHARIVHIRDGGGDWKIVRLDAENRTEKHLLMRMLARFVESVGADALIEVGEAWMLPENQAGVLEELDDIQTAPGRREVLQVTVATREGLLQSDVTDFTRGPFGGIKFGDTHRLDGSPFYLQPVFEVWHRQGYNDAPDGKRMRRIWEPDQLDICFCGGPKRFSECCGRVLDNSVTKREIDESFEATLKGGNFERAEELARAGLAQYVIWVRQHAAMMMNVAPDVYRQFVEVDIPAISSHIACLGEALKANGHSASYLPQLRHISTVIGVPEVSIRIVALSAQRLFESGNYSGAFEELKTLGNIDHLNDTLALILVSKLVDLPERKRTDLLTRAVAEALPEEERWFAQLALASQLLAHDQCAEALLNVDSVIRECRDKDHRETLASALCLRAQLTNDNEDIAAALRAMEAFADSEHKTRIAMMLIERGDLVEAERTLSEAVEAKEPIARLLAIDCLLRSGQIDAANEMLSTIERGEIGAHLHYPYAINCALWLLLARIIA